MALVPSDAARSAPSAADASVLHSLLPYRLASDSIATSFAPEPLKRHMRFAFHTAIRKWLNDTVACGSSAKRCSGHDTQLCRSIWWATKSTLVRDDVRSFTRACDLVDVIPKEPRVSA